MRGYGCPLSTIVEDGHDACYMVEELIAEITGAPVRECCQRDERPRCGFRVAERT